VDKNTGLICYNNISLNNPASRQRQKVDSFFFIIKKNQFHNLMKVKSIIGIIVVILIAAAVIYVFYYYLGKQLPLGQAPSQTPLVQDKNIAPLSATGDVGVAVDSLLREISDEEYLNAGVEAEAAIVKEDSQAVSDFGQSINDAGL